MNHGTRAALVAAAIVHASAAIAATEAHAPARTPAPVAEHTLPASTLRVAGLESIDEIVLPASVRVEAVAVPSKQKSAALPGSEAFVLLGMGVVLVGVLARQRRGFRRSGTILLR